MGAKRKLAIDPGKRTGVARWELGKHTASVLPYAEALELVDDQTRSGRVDLVVCEDFVISGRTLRSGTDGWRRGAELEFIGAARWMCHKSGIEFVLQRPVEAKEFASDDKLRRVGWYTPGEDHSRDASRHLLLALVKRGLVDPRDLLSKS